MQVLLGKPSDRRYGALMLDQDIDDIHPLFHGAPQTTEFKKLRKRIVRYTREAVEQYGMVEHREDSTLDLEDMGHYVEMDTQFIVRIVEKPLFRAVPRKDSLLKLP